MIYLFLFIILFHNTSFGNPPPPKSSALMPSISIAEKFDHEFHSTKVFNAQGIQCSKCHNFSVNPDTKKVQPEPASSETHLKLKLRQICHECHQGAETKNQAAPKTCYTCHSSTASIAGIMPKSHENVEWKKSHSLEARISGDSCLNCHTTSQCVKCHAQRNDISLRNHSRNFRFTHSVTARLQPQRCDACHTKSFCINCHIGRK